MKRFVIGFKILCFLIFFQGFTLIGYTQNFDISDLLISKNGIEPHKKLSAVTRINSGPDNTIMNVVVSGQLALCSHSDRGHIILDVNGGLPPYTFRWNNLETVQNRYDLLSGTYTVWIQDSLGNEVRERIIIQPPFPLEIEMSEINATSCLGNSDGEAKLKILKGRGEPYKIEWSHGLKNQLHAKNLKSGTYSVKVSDQFACSKTIYFEIKSNSEEMEISESMNHVSCNSSEDGAISIGVSGGIAPYTFSWSNGAVTNEVKGLGPGDYQVLIKDQKGCSISKTYKINAALPLEISGEVKSELLCFNSEEGEISLNIMGGTSPYTYHWSNGADSKDIQNLETGEYHVKVTDAKGCFVEKTFEIIGPEKLTAKIETALDINCDLGEAKGVAWVSIQGGKSPYQVKWQNGTTDLREIEIADEREITVEITDFFGCSVLETIMVDFSNIAAADKLDFNYRKLQLALNDEILVDEPLLFESAIAEDFIAWEWDFGDGTKSHEKDPIHIFKNPGEFEVVLRAFDMYGCSSVLTEEVKINQHEEFFLMPNAFSPNGDGLNDKFHPVAKGIAEYTMDIFNFWGEHVYSNANRDSNGWDGFLNGQALPNGNYIYKVHYSTLKGEKIQKTGTVTLLR